MSKLRVQSFSISIDGDHDVFGDGAVILKNAPRHTPASREKIEQFAQENGAQLWIGHGTSFFTDAIKSPGGHE